jgi:hypothetical protein
MISQMHKLARYLLIKNSVQNAINVESKPNKTNQTKTS